MPGINMRMLGALLSGLLLLAACGPSTGSEAATPEAATETVTGAASATEPVTAESPSSSASEILVEFWTTDHQPDRVAVYEALAQQFMEANPGVDLRIVAKDEADITADLQMAAAANSLPAIVRLGVERLPALAVDGLLDEGAASSVIRMIGIDDFRAGLLEMVTNLESNQQWAIPYDGWIQALWYRKDLFDAQGLAAPTTWEQINAACDTLAAVPDLQFGLTLPSDPTQNYAHQVFEQIAISNQAWPLTPGGEASFTTPEMVAALRFYVELQRCSAPAPQSVEQAAAQYLRGESVMLFYSTYIMDDLVEGMTGADGNLIVPSVEDLAQRTNFASGLVGPTGSASYGQVVALALLTGADPVAQDVAKFFLTDGYVEIIAIAPLGKIPVRQSVADRWSELSPLFENYSPATLGHIVNGYDTLHRWVLRIDYTNTQRAVIGEIESRLLIPQAISRILNGELTPESAAQWLQEETELLLAEGQ